MSAHTKHIDQMEEKQKEIKLITDSGIQVYAFEITIDRVMTFCKYYYEYYDDERGKWYLAPLYE